MKILIDARLYGLENAGLGRYLINLVENIKEIDTKNNYVLLLRKTYFESLKLPANWKKVLVDFPHYSFSEQFKLPGIIKRENPDLVHFPHFNVPILFRGKYIVTIHDMLMHKSVGLTATTLPAPMYFIRRLGYRFAFDSAVKRAYKIIVPSNAVKNELTKFYNLSNDKVNVTYEGVRVPEVITNKITSDSPYFIYTGNAYPHKNLERLIEAMVILNNKCEHQINLLIASSRGIFTQRLEKTIRNRKANKCVQLLGFVPDNELFSLFKNSIAYVSPSLSEGFGLPGLEAMTVGTLILASDIPVFKEIYEDNVIYFDPYNVFSIEDAMEKALKIEETKRVEIISKAKDFVKRYSWAKMAKETLNIYESCNSIRQSK
jgi:glycosyltransferase involved in cell wall biosynthesis